MTRQTILGLALAAAGLACATGSGAGGGPDPVGPIWRWTALRGPDPLEIERPGRYTLEFQEGGRYAFRADCNTGGGAFTLEGSRLELGPAAASLVACPPGSHGNRFAALLGRVERFERDGDRLVLGLEDDAGSLEFAAQPPVALPGSQWSVRAVNNGRGGVQSVALGTSLDAAFGSDGRLSGSAGCNRYTASFDVEGESLSIGPAAATRKLCSQPDGVMEQEQAFLTALASAARWEVRGERLQLRTAEGSLAVDLVSAVTGTLTSGARRALPPDARVQVELRDVSRADAAARVLGEQRFATRGKQLPLAFEVAFDPADIDPRFAYALGARVTSGDGRLLLESSAAHPVITRGSPTLGVEVRLDPARRGPPPPRGGP